MKWLLDLLDLISHSITTLDLSTFIKLLEGVVCLIKYRIFL